MILINHMVRAATVAAVVIFMSFPGYAAQKDLSGYEDRSIVSVAGVVKSTAGDRFTLDMGGSDIIVEMDGWDWFVNEAEQLHVGEKVTVTGRVDDNLFEKRTIEADTVYVHPRTTFYFANNGDEEGGEVLLYTYNMPPLSEGARISARGTVKNLGGGEFTLDTKFGNIQVDTGSLSYDPTDKIGFQRIRNGDQVYVSGIWDKSFVESNKIQAQNLIRLVQQDTPAMN